MVGDGCENIIVTVGWDHRVTNSLVFLRKAYGGNRIWRFRMSELFSFLNNGRGKLNYYPSKVFSLLLTFWRSERQKKRKGCGKNRKMCIFLLFSVSNDDERKEKKEKKNIFPFDYLEKL